MAIEFTYEVKCHKRFALLKINKNSHPAFITNQWLGKKKETEKRKETYKIDEMVLYNYVREIVENKNLQKWGNCCFFLYT